jgi:uncharacterized membrane protein
VRVRALWCLVIALVALGVAAAISRTVFISDLGTSLEPFRQLTFDALHRVYPLLLQRPQERARFDGRFAAHPVLARLHVGAGALFLILAPFQFSVRARQRFIAFHRWSGRVLLFLAFITGSSALYFGLVVPFGGLFEAIAITIFDMLFLLSITRAFIAIRRRQVARHREWMIRAFALAIAISTVRVVEGLLDLVLAPTGIPAADVFVIAIWSGWVLTLGAAELWIRYTRSSAESPGVPANVVS